MGRLLPVAVCVTLIGMMETNPEDRNNSVKLRSLFQKARKILIPMAVIGVVSVPVGAWVIAPVQAAVARLLDGAERPLNYQMGVGRVNPTHRFVKPRL
jgi:hypothetical protein